MNGFRGDLLSKLSMYLISLLALGNLTRDMTILTLEGTHGVLLLFFVEPGTVSGTVSAGMSACVVVPAWEEGTPGQITGSELLKYISVRIDYTLSFFLIVIRNSAANFRQLGTLNWDQIHYQSGEAY